MRWWPRRQRGRQAADGRPRLAVLPRVRLRPGGGPLGAVRVLAGRPFQPRDLQAGLVERDRRRRRGAAGRRIDLHIHDTHFIGLLCGVPRAVHSRGVVENGAVVHLTTQYLYDTPDLAVSCVSGALSQIGRPFAHGFEFYLDRATLAFEFANLGGQGHVAMPLSVILPDGTVERPELGAGRPDRRLRPRADGRASGRGRGPDRAGTRRRPRPAGCSCAWPRSRASARTASSSWSSHRTSGACEASSVVQVLRCPAAGGPH